MNHTQVLKKNLPQNQSKSWVYLPSLLKNLHFSSEAPVSSDCDVMDAVDSRDLASVDGSTVGKDVGKSISFIIVVDPTIETDVDNSTVEICIDDSTSEKSVDVATGDDVSSTLADMVETTAETGVDNPILEIDAEGSNSEIDGGELKSRTGGDEMSMDDVNGLISIVLLSAIILVLTKVVDCDSSDTVFVIDI